MNSHVLFISGRMIIAVNSCPRLGYWAPLIQGLTPELFECSLRILYLFICPNTCWRESQTIINRIPINNILIGTLSFAFSYGCKHSDQF